MRRSAFALMECDSAVTGPGQDVRRGKGSLSCNYRGAPCQGGWGGLTFYSTVYLSILNIKHTAIGQ